MTDADARRCWPTRRRRPEFAFSEALHDGAVRRTIRARRPMTPETVDEMNLDKSLAFYKDRFADASDFTFVFVGSFDLADDEAAGRALPRRPAVDPAGRKRGRTSASRTPTGVVDEAGREGHRAEEPDGDRLHRAVRVQPGAARRDPRDGAGARRRACARRCARISAAPTASRVSAELLEDPASRIHARRSTSAAIPTRTDELVKRVFQEIELLKTNGPTEKQVTDVQGDAAARLRDQHRSRTAICSARSSTALPDSARI